MGKVALIYPPGKNVIKKGLSLPVLYSYLKSHEIDNLIIDCPGLEYTHDKLCMDLDRYNPDIIGISVAGTCMKRDTIETCRVLRKKYPDNIGWAESVGLVGALQMVTRPGTTDPDHDTAFDIIKNCVESGLLLFAPVGTGGGTVKIYPPLCINRRQLEEGLSVLEEAYAKVLG